MLKPEKSSFSNIQKFTKKNTLSGNIPQLIGGHFRIKVKTLKSIDFLALKGILLFTYFPAN